MSPDHSPSKRRKILSKRAKYEVSREESVSGGSNSEQLLFINGVYRDKRRDKREEREERNESTCHRRSVVSSGRVSPDIRRHGRHSDQSQDELSQGRSSSSLLHRPPSPRLLPPPSPRLLPLSPHVRRSLRQLSAPPLIHRTAQTTDSTLLCIRCSKLLAPTFNPFTVPRAPPAPRADLILVNSTTHITHTDSLLRGEFEDGLIDRGMSVQKVKSLEKEYVYTVVGGGWGCIAEAAEARFISCPLVVARSTGRNTVRLHVVYPAAGKIASCVLIG